MQEINTLFIGQDPPAEGIADDCIILIDQKRHSAAPDGVSTLHDFYVSHGGHADFFALARTVFYAWAVQSRFLDQVVVNGKTLLCPLRWNFFSQLKIALQKAEMLDFAIRTLRPRCLLVSTGAPQLTHLAREAARIHGIPMEIYAPSGSTEKQTLVSKLLRKECSVEDVRNAIITKWHQTFTDNITYRFGKEICRIIGALKLRRFRLLKTKPTILFVSMLSNWQKVLRDSLSWREVLLGGVMEHAKKTGIDFVTLSKMDDQWLAITNTLRQPPATLQWEGISPASPLPMIPGLASRLQEWSEKQETRDPLSYKGMDLSALLIDRYANAMESFANSEVYNIERSKKWLEEISPKMLILIAEHSSVSSMVIAANEAGIPSIGLAHAATFPSMMMYMYSQKENLDLIPRCSTLCVWGKYEKEMISRNGAFYPENRIVAVGSPKSPPKQKGDVRAALKIKSTLPIALCTSNNRHHFFARDFMKQWQQCREEYHLVIKLHPRELNYREYHYWADRYGITNITIIKQYDMLALLKECTIHLSFSSTSILEAAWLNKPTLIFDEGLKNDPLEAVNMGVAYYVSDYDNFSKAFEAVLAPEAVRDFERARVKFLEKRFEPEITLEELVGRELSRLKGGSDG